MQTQTETKTFEVEARELASAALALIRRAEGIDLLLLRHVRSASGATKYGGSPPPPLIEVVEMRRALDKLEDALLAD